MKRRYFGSKAKSGSKHQKAGRSNLVGGHQLLGVTLRLIKANIKFLSKIVIVGLVVNIALRYTVENQLLATYRSLWFVFFSASLIWTIRHLPIAAKARGELSVGAAYWEGSAAALKLIVVLSLIVVASLPFSFGAFLFGTFSYLSLNSVIADVLAVGLWMLFGFVSLLLLARLSVAPVVATLPSVSPWQAIANSWVLTRRRTLAIARRLLLLLVYILVALAGVVALAAVTRLSAGWVQLLIEVSTFGLIVPLIYVYLFLLYKRLV